jgi:hypothetical protein
MMSSVDRQSWNDFRRIAKTQNIDQNSQTWHEASEPAQFQTASLGFSQMTQSFRDLKPEHFGVKMGSVARLGPEI